MVNTGNEQYFTVNELTKKYIKKNSIILFLILITSLFVLVKGILFPKYLGKLIPAIYNNSKDTPTLMLYTVGIYIVFLIGISIHEYFKILLKKKTQQYYINFFSQHILDNLEQEFIQTPESTLYNNIISFSDREDYFYDNIIKGLLPHIVILFGINIFIYYYDISSGIIFTITIIIYSIIFYYLQKRFIIKSTNMTHERDGIIKYSEDLNKNIDSILSLDKVDNEKENITIICENYGKTLWEVMSMSFNTTYISLGIFSIASFIILYRFYLLWKNKQIASEILITYIGVIFFFLNGELPKCTERIQSLAQHSGQKLNYLNKINEYLHKSISNKKSIKNNQKTNCLECILTLQNLNYTYRNGKNLFHNFNLKIYKGDIISLVGSNGSGKSTLLKLLFGIYRVDGVDGGNIYYNKDNINNIDIRNWRKHIHYCPQYPKLFNRTVEDNINYGNIDNNKLLELMKQLKLTNILLPLHNRHVGNGGEKLSGGQRQIITIFRLIANYKPIILLDEPTSALDTKSKNIVYQMLDYLKKQNTTILLVTHDPELMKKCNRSITLSNGKIIKDSINN